MVEARSAKILENGGVEAQNDGEMRDFCKRWPCAARKFERMVPNRLPFLSNVYNTQ
jgi:hypothetical protein